MEPYLYTLWDSKDCLRNHRSEGNYRKFHEIPRLESPKDSFSKGLGLPTRADGVFFPDSFFHVCPIPARHEERRSKSPNFDVSEDWMAPGGLWKQGRWGAVRCGAVDAEEARFRLGPAKRLPESTVNRL